MGTARTNRVRDLPPSDLFLDPTNPRLAGARFSIQDQESILAWLWRNKSVDELVDSILTSGFWDHEELFATEEDGKLVVVEGNRRLAAVIVILDPAVREALRISLPLEPSEKVLSTLEVLPVIIATREELWEFVGFKHVNGPQAWDSISKAEYIFRVRTNFGLPLDRIARSIGDRHDTVIRLYRGYVVLRQAQDQLEFDTEDCQQRRFPFSHLWTALGYTNVMEFLGVSSETLERPNPIPPAKVEKLRKLLLWLFGSRIEDIDPMVKRQNPDLRHLAEVLGDERGLKILDAGLPLASALEAARGDEQLFGRALSKSVHHLREAKRFVATGYEGDESQLEEATSAETLARSLVREMEADGRERESGPDVGAGR